MTIPVDADLSAEGNAPSQLFSAREIGELVLRKIGAFTTNDAAADSNELDVTLRFMELEVAELAGTERCQWLVPATIEIDLEPDTALYDDLPDSLGSALPATKIAYVIAAYIVDSAGVATPIELMRRRAYEDIPDKTTGGTPDFVHVDRLNDDPRLFVYPVPAGTTDDPTVTGLTLRLVVQTYAATVLGAESQETAGNMAHGFDRAWQKWLMLQTALAVGDGPVRQLDSGKITRLGGQAAASKSALMAYQNREKVSPHMRRTKRWGG